MFGSKLRSWMENHIVRPRKNRNKNKNGNSGNLVSANTPNGHKGTSYQGGDSTLGSPARRSEVSPIQNHTTSRVGWQSPQDNTTPMSPKSDHYPYRHMVKSTTSPKIVPNKSSYNFDNTINSCGDNFSKSADIKYNSKTMDYENRNCIKNGYQTSSSQQQQQQQLKQQQQQQNELLTQELKHKNNKKMNQSENNGCRTINNTSLSTQSMNIENRSGNNSSLKNNIKMINENHLSKNRNDELKKKSTTTSIVQQQQQQNSCCPIVIGNNTDKEILRDDNNYGNRSQLLSGYDMSEIRFVNGRQKTIRSQNESKYGKILSTSRTTAGDSNLRNLNNNSSNCINTRNENNFSNNNINNNNNNNNNNTNNINNNNNNNINNNINNNTINNNNNSSNNNYQNQPLQTTSYTSVNTQILNQQNGKKHLSNNTIIESQTTNTTNKIIKNRNEIINNRNGVMRTNRYSNCSTLSAPGIGGGGHHQLSHMINTLSSPESAYSTGYSTDLTDSTSPGASSYTPEYYINIRTGTHYFPKAVGSVGVCETGNRLKYGLNKIEETRQESIGNDMMHYHRRTESFDLGRNLQTKANLEHMTNYKNNVQPAAGMSPILQKNLALQNYKGIESPSPRQRCRIRTNPWFSNTDTSSSSVASFVKRNELDSGSTSSGIRSSSDAGTDEKNKKNGNKINQLSSDTDTSSTEKDFSIKTFSPNTIRRRKTEIVKIETKEVHSVCVNSSQQESDEDATLNEMMGKFDESYVYEKETDILSDSDPTDCPSDLDTGQDAEDECDTDELLDIDYIDTGSIQEIVDKDIYKNTGSCSYHNFPQEKRQSRMRRSRKQQDEGSSKRRKKLLRKKKSTDCNNSSNGTLSRSPIPLTRGCRSVGGTPTSLRRNQSEESKRQSPMAPLTNRSNSLTFTEIHSVRSRVLAIAESEKALLRADLEADVKYKQLIHEAETILVSLKTNVRETPTPVAQSPSPRRVCNVPTNKRVEMLRNCEVDLKRELAKTQNPKPPLETTEKGENLLLNKRLEILRFETTSVPNSPKACRFSPRKTHVTNFINQNASPTELMRRKSIPDPLPPTNATTSTNSASLSPRLQLNGRNLSPPKSPTPVRRRFRSQSPKCFVDSSDSDDDSKNQVKPHKRYTKPNLKQQTKEPTVSEKVHAILSKTKVNHKKIITPQEIDLKKKNDTTTTETDDTNSSSNYYHTKIVTEIEKRKTPLMTFRSIDIGNRNPEFSYCPQSEPLKRKIYTCSSTFDKIQKSLDIESDIPKSLLLNKISLLRKERRANKTKVETIIRQDVVTSETNDDDPKSNSSDKRQLILDTIEDLKRNLEDQSVELYGLNE